MADNDGLVVCMVGGVVAVGKDVAEAEFLGCVVDCAFDFLFDLLGGICDLGCGVPEHLCGLVGGTLDDLGSLAERCRYLGNLRSKVLEHVRSCNVAVYSFT